MTWSGVFRPLPPFGPQELPRSRPIFFIALFLSFCIFILDALTPQKLVVSILQDVPIALTGLTLDRRQTIFMVFLGIFSNILAEAINAHAEGAISSVAVANRLFSIVSFLLIGYLAMRIRESALEAGKTLSLQRRAERDRSIRALLEELSREGDTRNLLGRIATHLVDLLVARGIVFAAVRNGHWCAPILSDPPDLSFWTEGEAIPGSLALLMSRPFGPHSISQLSLVPVLERNGSDGGLVARLSPGGEGDILLFALDPREADAASILEEILPVLEDLLRRLELLNHLQDKNKTLVRQAAVIRDLVSGVSHDIRTPLLAQNMNMDLALDGAWGSIPPGISTLLEQMVQSNQSLLDLSNRLLLLSRYELNDQPMESALFPLSDLFDEIFQELAPLFDRKALRLRSWLPPETIEGDRRELKRLFLNLLDNAIKWSPQGEDIDVSCERRDERLVVTVSDRGPGIPPDMVPRLFRRFGGLHPGSGFGLGLYLAQQVARLHGGGISYRPGSPGSHFVVDLPARRVS